MIPSGSLVYLETSAVNFMADQHLAQDGKATQIYHAEKNTHFLVSPVTLWEIMLTSEPGRREQLIYYAQHLGCKTLLKSPAEFILDYIRAGCTYEGTDFTFASSMPLAKTWASLCNDNRRTFIFDSKEFKQSAKRLREGFSIAQKMVNLPDRSSNDPEWLTRAGTSLDELVREMKTASYESMSDVNKKCIKVGMMLMATVLCHGIGFEDPVFEAYWKKLKIKNVVDRFLHLFVNYESLLYSGPIAMMSHVAVSQMQPGGKITRGVLWDALHSIYLFHTNVFFSSDKHFKNLRGEKSHELFNKIIFLPDFSIHPVKSICYNNKPSFLNRLRYFMATFLRRTKHRR